MIARFAFSTAGGHEENQDGYQVLPHPANEHCWICAIADGQGGQPGARSAAHLAVQSVCEHATSRKLKDLDKPATWISILQAADAAVAKDRDAGFTTLIGFAIIGSMLIGASNGDSALIVASENRYPDTITSNQQKNPPLGSGAATIVSFATKLVMPWRVLAVTDGVWKYAGMERVHGAIEYFTGNAILEQLMQLARSPRTGEFQDDVTLVLFENSEK